MAVFGIKYYALVGDFSGNTYQVNIRQSGYTGTITQIEQYDYSPIVLNYDGSKTEVDLPVHGANATFTFYCDETAGQNFDDIFESNYGEYQLEISGSSLYWIGNVDPTNLVRGFLVPKYFIALNAVDGLAYLENYDYKLTGVTTVLQAINYCTRQTGLLNDAFVDQLNTVQNGVNNSVLNLYIHNNRFSSKDSSGNITYVNCKDALSYLLEPFNAILTQGGQQPGYWMIQQKNEVNSNLNAWNGALSAYAPTPFNRSLDITGNYFLAGSDELSKLAPTRLIALTQPDEVLTGTTNLIFNGSFGSSIAGWTNGSGANAFEDFQWSSGVMQVGQITLGQNSSHYASTTFYVTAIPTGNSLTISASLKVASVSFHTGTALPQVQFTIIDPTGGTFTDSTQTLTSSFATYYCGVLTTVKKTGLYKLEINIVPSAFANYATWIIDIDNVTANVSYPGGYIHDKLTTYSNIYLTTQLSGVSTTLQFFDSPVPVGIAAFLNDSSTSGFTVTSNWSGYDSYTGKKQFLNNHFSGGTISPWVQYNDPVLGSGQGWQYDPVFTHTAYVDNGGSGLYYSGLLMQSGFTSGYYNIQYDIWNKSTVISVNPNLFFKIWQKNGDNYKVIGQFNVSNTGSPLVSSIVVGVDQNNSEIGFSVEIFGPTTDLSFSIGQFQVLTYTSSEYQQSLQNLYAYQKLKKTNGFRDYLKLGVKQNQNLFFNTLPVINGTTYEICSYSYDILNQNTTLEMSEFIDSGIVTMASTTLTLPTINGN